MTKRGDTLRVGLIWVSFLFSDQTKEAYPESPLWELAHFLFGPLELGNLIPRSHEEKQLEVNTGTPANLNLSTQSIKPYCEYQNLGLQSFFSRSYIPGFVNFLILISSQQSIGHPRNIEMDVLTTGYPSGMSELGKKGSWGFSWWYP